MAVIFLGLNVLNQYHRLLDMRIMTQYHITY